ncbi:hypothetical protein ACLOJK_015320 [Asimina triloba]
MVEGRLISSEDLALIRDCYEILSNIVLSTSKPHETPRDRRPGYICMNEFMFKTGVQIPFEFGVADLLQGFRKGYRADRYFLRALLVRKSIQGYVTFIGKGDAELIDNLPDLFVSERDSWGVPDWWEKRLPEPVSASTVGLEAHQRLAQMYLQGTSLHWFPLKEVFLCWCKALTHLAALAASGEKAGKEEVPLEEGTSVSGGASERRGDRPSNVAPIVVSEALAEPDHARMMGPASAGPLEGIFVVASGRRSAGPISTDVTLLPEGPSGPLFREGPPQMINLEEEGGPTPSSVSMGEPKLFASEGSELEITEGDVALLCKQVALLRSREAKLLFECEAAQAELDA